MKKCIVLLILILCSCTNITQHEEEKTISKLTDKFVYTNGVCLRDNVKIYYSSFNRGEIIKIVDEDEDYYYVKSGALTLAIQKQYIRTEKDKPFEEYNAFTRSGSNLYSNAECNETTKTFSLNDEVKVIDEFAGVLLIETDDQIGYMKPSQVSKNKIPKYVAPKKEENETYVPDSGSGGGGGGGGGSSSDSPSSPSQDTNTPTSGDGEDVSLYINIPKYEHHFISYSNEISGTILMDDTKTYITTVNRNDSIYILDENDDKYTILINGYKGIIDKRYVRKEDETPYEQFEGYTTSGAKLYKDFEAKETMLMFGINEKITIIDEVDGIYVVQLSSGETGYMKKTNVSKNKIVIAPKVEKPEIIEEAPSSSSGGGGSSSPSSPAPAPQPSTDDWTPAAK